MMTTGVCLRAIEETGHHSLVFEKAETGGQGLCRCVGYRMFSDEDLKRAHDYFNGRGEEARFVGSAPDRD